tara:strand:+ start:5219 stop:6388 length:1170 start_codon:yes stop_codon:yes gene_type:complete
MVWKRLKKGKKFIMQKFFLTLVLSIYFFNISVLANENDIDLPKTMVWSTYGLASSSYGEASAFAEALMRNYNMRVRLKPSGTGIGRLLPLKKKRVSLAFLGSESFFASEGIYDFSAKSWGPQNLRVIIARPNTFGIAVPANTNIHKIEDLKGKKIAYVTANPSVNVKVEAIMSFANLTWDDVTKIIYPAFSPTIKALQTGKVDAAGAVPTGPAVYELAASKKGIRWLDMPKENIEGWKKLQKVIPFMHPQIETLGAGLSESNSVELGGYRYPTLTVYADTSEDEVYNFIKAIDYSYKTFKNITPVMYKWNLELVAGTPIDAPVHKGAIKYLKEKNLWSQKDEEWNIKRIKRLNTLIEGWKIFLKDNINLKDEEFKIKWLEERKKLLAKL